MKRNVLIDLLRAAAILPVFAGHWVDASVAAGGRDVLSWAFLRFASHGGRGVMLFFVISGFVITRSVMAREKDLFAAPWRGFYVRRIARIVPLLVATCLIGAVLIAVPRPADRLYGLVIRDPHAAFDWRLALSLVTFTFNWLRILNDPVSPNWGMHWDVLWSLAVEEQFYLTFPLLLWLAASRKRLLVIVAFIIVSCSLFNLVLDIAGIGGDLYQINSFRGFYLIATGLGAAVMAERVGNLDARALAGAGGGILACGYVVSDGYPFGLLMGLGAAMMLVATTKLKNAHAWPVRLASRIGQLSYGLYLLHPAILYCFGAMLGSLGLIFGYLGFAAICVGVAAISYACFERPADRWLRRHLLAREERPAPAVA